MELYILRELWFGTLYLERTLVWNYISCENYGLELYILKELWFEESLPALKGKLPHSRKKHSRKWVYNVPNSPGNGSTLYNVPNIPGNWAAMYQTVQEMGLQGTKQSKKLGCYVPNSPGNCAAMHQKASRKWIYTLQCIQSRKWVHNVPNSPGSWATMYPKGGFKKKVQIVCQTNFQMMMNR